ncbi:MAG: ATPase, partial [Clostridiales bacterium]|nr:ATPase [Clostridiales bacterium]
ALALGMEPGEEDSMKRKPRSSKAGVFAGGVGGDIAYQGFFVALITLVAYFVGHFIESGVLEVPAAFSPDGVTMAFLTMSMAEIFQSFNMRSRRGSIFTMKTTNWWLWGAGIVAFLLTTAVIYVPFLRNLFGFTTISLAEYGIAIGLAFLIIPLVELVKLIQRKTGHGEKDEDEKENDK